jgi:hypothetical protein
MNSPYDSPLLPNSRSDITLRTIFVLSYPMPKRSTHQALYIIVRPSELKPGHLTTFRKRHPASSNMRLIGISRLIVMKMSMSTLMRMAQQEGRALGLIHLSVAPHLWLLLLFLLPIDEGGPLGKKKVSPRLWNPMVTFLGTRTVSAYSPQGRIGRRSC